MGKKCIPGVLCIENMTLFLLFVLIVLIIYLYYTLIIKVSTNKQHENPPLILNIPPLNISSSAMNTSGLSDSIPPLRIADGAPPVVLMPGGMRPGIPINIETRGTTMDYSQVGILTKKTDNDSPLILPLMGRQSQTGRDKWEYYTMSNTGTINTKLPVRVNGKSCTGEYGCDSISSGDSLYVDGYDSNFRANVYDSASFRYIPYL
jgi:hypothetical protein